MPATLVPCSFPEQFTPVGIIAELHCYSAQPDQGTILILAGNRGDGTATLAESWFAPGDSWTCHRVERGPLATLQLLYNQRRKRGLSRSMCVAPSRIEIASLPREYP